MNNLEQNSQDDIINTNEERKFLISKKEEKRQNEIRKKKKAVKTSIRKLDKFSEEIDEIDKVNIGIFSKYKINRNLSNGCWCFMTKVMPIFIHIFYLASIFIIIQMLGSIEKVLKNTIYFFLNSIRKDPDDIIKLSIKDFNKYYNFFTIFYESIKYDQFDFNLLLLSNVIGYKLFQFKGFIFSVIICFVIIAISIFFIMIFSFWNYDYNYNTYSVDQILFLLSIFVLLFLGVGAAAPLTQQLIIYFKFLNKMEKAEEDINPNNENNIFMNLIENLEERPEPIKTAKTMDAIHLNINDNNNSNYSLITKNKKKKNDKKKMDLIKYTAIIFITLIIAYIGKYSVCIYFIYPFKENMNITGCNDDIACYQNNINDKNLFIKNPELFQELIFNTFIYNRDFFYLILPITGIPLLIAIVLYLIFYYFVFIENEEEEKEKENKINVTNIEFCGFPCVLIKPLSCVCKLCYYCLSLLKILLDFVIFAINTFIKLFFELVEYGDVRQKSEKCLFNYHYKSNPENEEENISVFSCFKVEPLLDWLHNFLFSEIQLKIMSYVLGYILLDLSIIAFDKQYFDIQDEEKEDNTSSNKLKNLNLGNIVARHYLLSSNNGNNNNNLLGIENDNANINASDISDVSQIKLLCVLAVLVATLFIFFYITISSGLFRKVCAKMLIKNETSENGLAEFNVFLQGIYSIIWFNGIISLISHNLLPENTESSNDFIFYLPLIPIFMDKFYYCVLIYFSINYSAENNQSELIKGSALISIVLKIWGELFSMMKNLISISYLYNIQFVTSIIICSLFLLLFSYRLIFICRHSGGLIYLCKNIPYILSYGYFCEDQDSIKNINSGSDIIPLLPNIVKDDRTN